MRKLLLSIIVAAVLFVSVNVSMGKQVNYGDYWLNMLVDERIGYVWGFADGQAWLLSETGVKPTSLKCLISASQSKVIADIMVQFYRDPANTYIPWAPIACIANFKLQGGSEAEIEKFLEGARREKR